MKHWTFLIFIGVVVVAVRFASYADESPASDRQDGMKAVAVRGCSDFTHGTLRMHAPKARFFRMNGECRRFKATVGFDPAIHSLVRSCPALMMIPDEDRESSR